MINPEKFVLTNIMIQSKVFAMDDYIKLVKKVQIDAYNQAIDDAAEYAIVEETNKGMMSYYQVDKESILELKIKNDG